MTNITLLFLMACGSTLSKTGPPNGRLHIAKIPFGIRVPMQRNIFLSNAIPPNWYAKHEVICTIEGVETHYKHNVKMYKKEMDEKLFMISKDTSAIAMPIIMLQMIIRSEGRPDTKFQHSCWIPIDDDFEIRTVSNNVSSGYFVSKYHGFVRIAFFASNLFFRQMAWAHDHYSVVHTTNNAPFRIEDLSIF